MDQGTWREPQKSLPDAAYFVEFPDDDRGDEESSHQLEQSVENDLALSMVDIMSFKKRKDMDESLNHDKGEESNFGKESKREKK